MRSSAYLAAAAAALMFTTAGAVAYAQTAPAWTVDKARSKLGFQSAFSGIKFDGQFNDWNAVINFDPNNLAQSKATVTINLASARTGDKDRDETLPTGDWFNVKQTPQATFVTTAIRANGPNRYIAAGNLTIRGVSRPVSLPFTLNINGRTAVMNGQVVINRSQWGVGGGQFAGPDTVPHQVTVNVSVTANRS